MNRAGTFTNLALNSGVRRIEIDQSLWDEQDKALVEDLVAAAVNMAIQIVDEKVKERQQGMMAGMPLPPGFSL